MLYLSRTLNRIKNAWQWNISVFLFSIFFFSVSISGCGYMTQSSFTAKYRSISLAPIENKIEISRIPSMKRQMRVYRPGLEMKIAKATMQNLAKDGTFRVMVSDSDLILRLVLMDYQKDPSVYTSDEEILQYRVNIKVNTTVVDARTGDTLIERNIIGDSYQLFTGRIARSEEEAIDLAITDLADRIQEFVCEGPF